MVSPLIWFSISSVFFSSDLTFLLMPSGRYCSRVSTLFSTVSALIDFSPSLFSLIVSTLVDFTYIFLTFLTFLDPLVLILSIYDLSYFLPESFFNDWFSDLKSSFNTDLTSFVVPFISWVVLLFAFVYIFWAGFISLFIFIFTDLFLFYY